MAAVTRMGKITMEHRMGIITDSGGTEKKYIAHVSLFFHRTLLEVNN